MSLKKNTLVKGGNICKKFTSMQYAREAIYKNISSELSPLEQQQQKIVSIFEYTVAGVARALEGTNTGWNVDASFKNNGEIEPVSVLPQNTSSIDETEVEIWNTNIDPFYDTRLRGQLLIEDIFSNNTRFCSCHTTTVSYGGEVRAQCDVKIYTRNNSNNSITTNEIRSFRTTMDSSSRPNERLEPIAGGFYTSDDNKDYILILLKGKDNNNSPKLWKINYELNSSTSIQTLMDITPSNLLTDASNFPIVAAQYSTTTSSIYAFAAKTDQVIYYANVQAASPTFSSTAIYCWSQCDNWFAAAVKNEKICLAVLDFTNGIKKFQVYNKQGNDWNNYWNNISSYYLNNYSGLFFGFSRETNYLVLIAQDDTNCEIFVHGIVGSFKIPLSGIKNCFLSDSYIYLLKDNSNQYTCRQYDLQTKTLSNYIQTFDTVSDYGYVFYFDRFYFMCDEYMASFINKELVPVLNEVSADVPLSAFVNLTHSSGAQLQLSCVYNSKRQLLFDNGGSSLYSNDIGFSYLSKNTTKRFDTQSIDTSEPQWHICAYNNNGYNSGFLKEEIINNISLGKIDYFVVSNSDGKFVGLMLKNNNKVIANIGCGDLLPDLQYPEYDTAQNAHTLYYSLGFVNNNLSAVPRDNNPANSLIVAFVAPTVQDFRFYGGQNQDATKDSQYFAQGSSYKYIHWINTDPEEQILNIDNFVYTMPILIGLSTNELIALFKNTSGIKGLIHRGYLVMVRLNNKTVENGFILDNGNYLYLGNNWALGWDSLNDQTNNPYGVGE